MDDGHLCFEYNMMIIQRYLARSKDKLAPGKHTIVVDTTLKAPRPGSPVDIVLSVDGQEVARTLAKITVPAAFSASETFDVGVDLGSPVSRDYFERRPFKFRSEWTDRKSLARWRRSPSPPPSARARPSTSAWTLARRSRATISSGVRSNSMGRSAR